MVPSRLDWIPPALPRRNAERSCYFRDLVTTVGHLTDGFVLEYRPLRGFEEIDGGTPRTLSNTEVFAFDAEDGRNKSWRYFATTKQSDVG